MTEAFNRSDILADWPTAALPWGAATEDRLDATQSDVDAAAKRFWQRSSWYRRASVRNQSLADQPVMDDLPTQGAVSTDEVMEAAAAGDLMARRRVEDERFAYFAEASIVFLDLPDAVFRGYEGDEALLGSPRDDDPAPFELLRQEINRLEPQKVYFPLGVGGHVDHQLCREAGVPLLQDGRRWVMPVRSYAGIVTFYEDFPYAWWNEFRGLEDLGANPFDGLPGDVSRPRSSPTSPTTSSARSWASTCTRARSSGSSTAPERWPTPRAPTPRAWPTSGRSSSSAGSMPSPSAASGRCMGRMPARSRSVR